MRTFHLPCERGHDVIEIDEVSGKGFNKTLNEIVDDAQKMLDKVVADHNRIATGPNKDDLTLLARGQETIANLQEKTTVVVHRAGG